MGKTELLEIISSFSESKLEEIIFSTVREIFFSGDWGTANAMIDHILKCNGNVDFKGRITGFGIFAAVRARNIKQALDRYEYLEMLDLPDNLSCLKANGLADLSDLLFPDNTILLCELWQRSIKPGLPRHIQEKYAKVGGLLCGQLSKIHAGRQYETLTKIMKKNLDSGIYAKTCQQIKVLCGEQN